MRKTWLEAFSLLLAAILLGGCSQIMSSLRKDIDDPEPEASAPTVGGRWSERGFLGGDQGARVPASMSGRDPGNPEYDSWVNPDREDANRRDMYRYGDNDPEGPATFSQTANLPPPTRRQYKNGSRATRDDFVDESENEGSLWASSGQTNYYFTKNKVRSIGDIVSVTVEPDLFKDISLEVRRGLTQREREIELGLAQERLRLKAMGQLAGKSDSVASSAAAPKPAPDNAGGDTAAKAGEQPQVEVPQPTLSDIDVGPSLETKAGDTIMAEIIERYPNGNYKIRGVKKIPYKNGNPRMVSLTGVARASDITEDDVIPSGKLYEYRLDATR